MSKRREPVDRERSSLVEKINARSIFNSEQGIPDEDDTQLQQWRADLVLYDRRLEGLREMIDEELTKSSRSYGRRDNGVLSYRDTY